MSHPDGIRRADIALVAGQVVALGLPGAALLLWAETRSYRDNQQNWATIGGWAALGLTATVLLVASAALVRNRGSRRIQVAFGLLTLNAAIALLAAAVSIEG